ncbi:hypothetical protein SGCZBJ_12840 [Caulobacter zeae]|uniref:EF-hand domain-containing protein n=1 Tax=Caulobacter zeae TaxID=2055137 RepID=A0A2N5DGC1_9CAUL|nr:EF-hand domain-containing protein [Caulobacter zeae]PLR25114.1 hypothetical protein SGCZBJ_12840 [Caulobacter zeae]
MKTFTTLVAATAIAACAVPALAQTKPAGEPQTAFQSQRAGQMLAKLDANKDGKLSRTEFEAMRQKKADGVKAGRGERLWGRLDADKDGFLSRAELEAMAAKRFKRMDADGDGVLTSAERQAAAGKAKAAM